METIRHSKLVTAGYHRIKEQIDDSIKKNARLIEKELQKKISLLEFYHKELASRKEKLSPYVQQLISIKERIQHSLDSLRYPKEICDQCIEVRKAINELQNDSAHGELKREIDLIVHTQLFFKDLIHKLEEQTRRHRATIYTLEKDYARKSNTLKIEKNNKTIKTTDIDINPNRQIPERKSLVTDVRHRMNTDWEEESKIILKDADVQHDAGLKLQLHAEENLTLKINALMTQHHLCTEAFNQRVIKYKCEKGDLESKCSQLNEEISQQKLNIRNIEDLMVENENYLKLAEKRLSARTESTYTELMKDNVESVLLKELRKLNLARDEIRNKWSQAVSTLKRLNEKKRQYELKIRAKIDAIKIDEVECLTLLSSIHYYAY